MFTFDVEPDGAEKFRVVATSRDIAMWERTTKGASMARLEADLHMTDLVAVAHRACLRRGVWTGDLEAFREQVDITPIDVAKEAAEKAAGERDDQTGEDESGPTPPAL